MPNRFNPTSIDPLLQAAAALSPSQLRELHAAIAALASATAPEGGPPADREGGDGDAGYIEWKIVTDSRRGKVYGPYPYLCYVYEGELQQKFLREFCGTPPAAVLAAFDRARQDMARSRTGEGPAKAAGEGSAEARSREFAALPCPIVPGMEVEIGFSPAYGNRYEGQRGVVLDVIPDSNLPDLVPLARVALAGASTDYVFRQDCLTPVAVTTPPSDSAYEIARSPGG